MVSSIYSSWIQEWRRYVRWNRWFVVTVVEYFLAMSIQNVNIVIVGHVLALNVARETVLLRLEHTVMRNLD